MASSDSNSSTPTTILITGGNGFLGSHLTSLLSSTPHLPNISLHATHRNNRSGQFSHPSCTYHICDLTSQSATAALIAKVNPTLIIHTLTPGVFAPPKPQYEVNYLSTKYLLDEAKKSKTVRAFVYTSSCEAVGLASGFYTKPETEEQSELCTLEKGSNAYGRTKGAADALVLATNTRPTSTSPSSGDQGYSDTLVTTVIRLPGVYGPRDTVLSGRMLDLINTSGTTVQLGQNKAWHDWVYVESAAYAHILAAKALLSSPPKNGDLAVDGEAFFITDGSPIRYWDFARKLWALAGDKNCSSAKPKTTVIPMWVVLVSVTVWGWIYKVATLGMGGQPQFTRRTFEFIRKGCWYDIEKAKKRLGYEPPIGTEEGLRKTVEWWKEEQKKTKG